MNIGMFLLGVLFGFGLLVSGMANPQKVQNFLDLSGSWDASLAFVMGGAVWVTLWAFARPKKKAGKPLRADSFHLPAAKQIDRRLLAGAALFGIGWGLVGVCPGPALVLTGMLRGEMLWFMGAMLVGMWLFRLPGQKHL
ncbi:MAG: hypothetical protein Q4G28_05300 [Neisseria sp.]|nr:hypothetical protein [Neisseria sp.]